MRYQIGKRYKFTNEKGPERGVIFKTKDASFVVHGIDSDGDAYSRDIVFAGMESENRRGWCVAELEELKNGAVVPVEDCPAPLASQKGSAKAF